ncbi:hypothetical protein E2C01_003016 [Portunus trituberculatus]|uniref:Uncharacterized protein n=1 Tax=Portunus trituberculatus TaxID=210409 RepID=A0A5B7CL15_PORTR|nr:hypothetical protein [Portunus trituberculatus]
MQRESWRGELGASEERRSIAFSCDGVLRPQGTPLAGYSDLGRGARCCCCFSVTLCIPVSPFSSSYFVSIAPHSLKGDKRVTNIDCEATLAVLERARELQDRCIMYIRVSH